MKIPLLQSSNWTFGKFNQHLTDVSSWGHQVPPHARISSLLLTTFRSEYDEAMKSVPSQNRKTVHFLRHGEALHQAFYQKSLLEGRYCPCYDSTKSAEHKTIQHNTNVTPFVSSTNICPFLEPFLLDTPLTQHGRKEIENTKLGTHQPTDRTFSPASPNTETGFPIPSLITSVRFLDWVYFFSTWFSLFRILQYSDQQIGETWKPHYQLGRISSFSITTYSFTTIININIKNFVSRNQF